ncbi:MAG: alpha-ketoglutarate-dependent dioxygenase AlkB [Bacteroidota bacterium]
MPVNLLPQDGEVLYYPDCIPAESCDQLFNELIQNIPWQQDAMEIYGRKVDFPRLTAWIGDDGRVYAYSGITNEPKPWTPALLQIKQIVEKLSGRTFNSALLNYYRSGNDSMGWHSDNEKELGVNPCIASVSLGQARKFSLKHKAVKGLIIHKVLSNGSLLLMQGETQHHWLHQVPKTKQLVDARINITFREIL